MSELEQDVGFVECNTLVVGLLREALVAQAWEALGRLPAAKRGTSVLINDLGRLLQDMGQLEEARPLLEEALQGERETLGEPEDAALDQLTGLLAEGNGPAGEGEAAARRRGEVLQERMERLGDRNPSTLHSISLLVRLPIGAGQAHRSDSPLHGGAAPRHTETRLAAKRLVLREVGSREKAEALADKHGLAA